MDKLFKFNGFLPFLIVVSINAAVDLAHKITIHNTIIKVYDGTTLTVLSVVVNALILLPFIMLFSVSGYINDKYNKTKVVRICAIVDVVITAFLTLCYVFGFYYLAFAMTFLLATQSAIYSPAKYSLIKYIVKNENLGAANGVVQAVTIISILLSMSIFSLLFEKFFSGTNPSEILRSIWFLGLVLFIASCVELFFAFKIPIFEFKTNLKKIYISKLIKLEYLKENLKLVYANKTIFICIIGISIFWAIAQLIIATFATHFKVIMNNDNVMHINTILALASIGIAIGAMIVGSYSKRHIEIGIVPFGLFGISISLFMLASGQNSAIFSIASFIFGVAGGALVVPLNAMIQYFTPKKDLGRVLAGNNFIQNIFMILFLVLSTIFVSFGSLTIGIYSFLAFFSIVIGFFAIKQLPHLFARMVLLPFLKLGYKIEVNGIENIPQRGSVLLLGNHVSWIDWLVLQVATPRPIKFVMFRSFYDHWYCRWFFDFFRVIPIGNNISRDAIRKIQDRLTNGEVVGLFPEGHITYNGQIDEFQKGFELAAKNSGCKIIPFYIHGLWGSSFSRASKAFKAKNSGRNLSVTFGEALSDDTDAVIVKKAVNELAFYAWGKYIDNLMPIQYNWIKQAKKHPFKQILVDSTGARLNNCKFLTAVLIFLSKFKYTFQSDEKNVGVILPSSAAGSIINMVLFIMGKVPINLNYTLNEQILINCVKKANIKNILTSSLFVEKLKGRGFNLENSIGDKLIYLEEVGKTINKKDKIFAALKALFVPRFVLEFTYFRHTHIDEVATIIFSSGSEGDPKGIVLSHKNLMANIKQISGLLNSDSNEVILASLPIFHSFGLTVTTLLPLNEGLLSVSIPDPTDAQTVGIMATKYKATVMFGTSTFFRIYTRSKRMNPLMFDSLRYVIAGAEKLRDEVKKDFRLRFGKEIYEGYGTTETAPVVSCNTPNALEPDFYKELTFCKEKSVGLPLPGTIIKIVDPVTYKNLGTNNEGLILIGGHQVMVGYYKNKAKTDEAIITIDGVRYYVSGDIGYIDNDGFIFITDRLSRFAKLGGEMISLGAIEGELGKVLDEDIHFITTNLPDDKKGEKVVLIYSGDINKDDIRQKFSTLAPIMRPSEIYQVDELPILGSGKVDLKETKELAIKLSKGEQ